jgi:outer membrane protein insertion porin family
MLGNAGDIYNADLIEKSVEALTAAAAEQGEPFGRILPRIDRDPTARTISVVYVVERGSPEYIERIEITGNHITKDEVIRREFRIAEGSLPDRTVLTVNVEEQQTGELSFAAGYSTANGIIGKDVIEEKLFDRRRDLFSDLSAVFMDTTSLSF